MNSFFKQLLGSLVQIGINELGRKQVSGVRYQGSGKDPDIQQQVPAKRTKDLELRTKD